MSGYWQYNPLSDKRKDFLRPILHLFLEKQSLRRQLAPLSPDEELRRGQEIEHLVERVLTWTAQADPTPSGKYGSWLLRLYRKRKIALPEDISKLHDMLSQFTKIRRHLPLDKRDINSYRTDGDLFRVLREHEGAVSKRGRARIAAAEGQKLILSDPPFEVWEISTVEAAAQLLRGTNWCVKDPKWAKDYLAEAPLYLIIEEGDYIALAHYSEKHSASIMDVADEPAEDSLLAAVAPIIKEILPGAMCECGYYPASRMCSVCEQDKCPECLSGCDNCSNEVGNDCCYGQCDDCGRDLCTECLTECGECADGTCSNCVISCVKCNEDFCQNCINKCSYCSKNHCAEDLYHCIDCNTLTCSDCSNVCAECDDTLCPDCGALCSVCGTLTCNSCTESCMQCGASLCSSCSEVCNECEETKCGNCMGVSGRGRTCEECAEKEDDEDE